MININTSDTMGCRLFACEETVKTLRELSALDVSLEADVIHCMERCVGNVENKFWRRSLVSAAFARFEIMINCLKNNAHGFTDSPQADFPFAEKTLRADEVSELGENETPWTNTVNPELNARMKFAFNSFARAHQANFKFKTDNDDDRRGWNAFLKSIEVRNRLMCPKSSKELEVSTDEVALIIEANIWFKRIVVDLLDANIQQVEREYEYLFIPNDELMSPPVPVSASEYRQISPSLWTQDF